VQWSKVHRELLESRYALQRQPGTPTSLDIRLAQEDMWMLENLAKVVPPQRVALLRAELELLGGGVDHDFRDPEDRLRAASADSLGVGGAT
jgi:hypothetical protein